jgi:hypothetical protein
MASLWTLPVCVREGPLHRPKQCEARLDRAAFPVPVGSASTTPIRTHTRVRALVDLVALTTSHPLLVTRRHLTRTG